MHAVIISVKRGQEFDERGRDIWESLEGTKGRDNYCTYIAISKPKLKKKGKRTKTLTSKWRRKI